VLWELPTLWSGEEVDEENLVLLHFMLLQHFNSCSHSFARFCEGAHGERKGDGVARRRHCELLSGASKY